MAITRLGGANAITGTLPAANINDTSIGNITALPAGVGGKVLQVVSFIETDPKSVTGTTFQAIPDFTLSITPSSTSSKILVQVNLTIGGGSSDVYNIFKLTRGGSVISDTVATNTVGSCVAGSWSNNVYYSTELHTTSYTYLDSPSSTSAQTYAVQVRPMGTVSRTFYLNRPSNTDDSNRGAGTSTITLMEIAG